MEKLQELKQSKISFSLLSFCNGLCIVQFNHLHTLFFFILLHLNTTTTYNLINLREAKGVSHILLDKRKANRWKRTEKIINGESHIE
jgi:hypothetical protein